jgi:hypothetical protein
MKEIDRSFFSVIDPIRTTVDGALWERKACANPRRPPDLDRIVHNKHHPDYLSTGTIGRGRSAFCTDMSFVEIT